MEDYFTTTSFETTNISQTIDLSGLMAGASAFFVAYSILLTIIPLLTYLYQAITLGQIFKKSGMPAWVAWVPIYNAWKFFELGGYKGANIFLALIPLVGPIIVGIMSIIAANRIGKKFCKSGAFVLLYIFLNPIWYGVLAFGKSQVNSTSAPVQAPVQPTVATSEPTAPQPEIQPQPAFVSEPVIQSQPVVAPEPTIQPQMPVEQPQQFAQPQPPVEEQSQPPFGPEQQ